MRGVIPEDEEWRNDINDLTIVGLEAPVLPPFLIDQLTLDHLRALVALVG
jgi:hypothetical protein